MLNNISFTTEAQRTRRNTKKTPSVFLPLVPLSIIFLFNHLSFNAEVQRIHRLKKKTPCFFAFFVSPCLIFLCILGLANCNSKPFHTLKGKTTNIDIKTNTKAIVYFFMVPDCPFAQFYTMSVNQVYSQYYTKDVQFFGIVPGNLYSLNEIDSFKYQYNFLPEILIDKTYSLAKKYNVKVVPQVVVTDVKGNVLYTGKIDDQAILAGQKKYQPTQFYLLDALKNISLGKPVKVKRTNAVGCYIE